MAQFIWIYEFILFMYGLSLLTYTVDLFKKNWRIKQAAFWLLCLTWLMHTAVLIGEIIQTNSLPIWTIVDVLYVYSWLLIALGLLINLFFTVQFIEICVNIFTFFLLLLAIMLDFKQQGIHHADYIVHEILVAHISFTVVAYVSFTISFLLSIMYLLQYQLLRKKKGFRWIWQFTDLKKLDTYSFTAILVGVPLLAIGLILGFIWAYTSGSEFYWMDLKTLGSIILLGIYVAAILLRLAQGYRGKPTSMLNTATFLVLLVNFFLFSVWSDFHF